MLQTNILTSFYRGKRIFLTGHTGFKGAWLLGVLRFFGAEVKGFALAPHTNPNLYDMLEGDTLCDSTIGDITNKAHITKEILDFQPDIVFHLAAQAIVRRSYNEPVDTFDVNVVGTAHVLEAVRLLPHKCAIVCITTDKVYENQEWIYPYRENDRLGGHDPYSASKACAELVAASYTHSFFNPKEYDKHQKSLITVRAGNVIGGGDWAKDRILPDIVKALAEQEPIILRNPNAVRPWQHVLEPVVGYIELAYHLTQEPLTYQGAWNFGPALEDNLTVEEITQIAIEVWGQGSYRIQKPENAPHEANLLRLDISKAYNFLKWKPRLNSRQAIKFTLQWYKAYYEKDTDMQAYTWQSIETYLQNQLS